ncbi:MAG: methyltransferase [Gammaproteobacteria bacterium]|jgi:hypothetical protein
MEKLRNDMISMLMSPLFVQCLAAVAKLKIADHLNDGAKTSNELAKLTETNENALYRLLRLVVSYGIFEEKENRIFELNELGSMLVSSNPNSLYPMARYLNEEDCYFKTFENLLYTIKTGKPAFEKTFNLPFFEYLKQNETSRKNFNRYMVGKFTPVFKSAIKSYDFSQFGSIVDIGGGNGNFILEILNANKNIQGYIFDLLEVKSVADLNIKDAGLSDRCKFIGGDFFTAILQQADAYMMKSIIHDWQDDDAIKILKNCRKIMRGNNKLLIMEQIISPDKPHDAVKLSDMLMLLLFGSKERTKEEFASLLAQADLKINNIFSTDTEFSILEIIPI